MRIFKVFIDVTNGVDWTKIPPYFDSFAMNEDGQWNFLEEDSEPVILSGSGRGIWLNALDAWDWDREYSFNPLVVKDGFIYTHKDWKASLVVRDAEYIPAPAKENAKPNYPIDWQGIPACYNWAAMDEDRDWYLYEVAPMIYSGHQGVNSGKWGVPCGDAEHLSVYMTEEQVPSSHWKLTLTRRDEQYVPLDIR